MSNQISYYQNKLKYETDASDLFSDMDAELPVVVVDARSAEAFEKEHIPTAINIPHSGMSEEATRHMDRSVRYVVYCDGIGCNASTKGALKMAQLGFSAKELIGGLDWWRRDGYATEGRDGIEGKAISCGC